MRKVYLDYAATTPVDPRVVKAMSPFFASKFGNANSLHSFGRDAADALENSRKIIADSINAKPEEIIFTGSGTEGSNMALKGVALANREKGKHIVTSSIEHHCVLESSHWLKRQGFDVTFLPVDKYGMVSPADVEKSIRPDTTLVAVMHANNEIGTIEPIEEIGKICAEKDVYFYTDAAQSFGKIPVDVEKMNVDMLMGDAHKIYGPKGVGFLYVRRGTRTEPIIHGGGQEHGMRSATVNVASIVGFAKAVELRMKEMEADGKFMSGLRDNLIKGVLEIENSHLNGHPTKRLPNNANFWFSFIEGESLVLELDSYGIAASTGSACSSSTLEPSHVLMATGLKPQEAHGSLRMTLGKWNTNEDVERVFEVLPKVVERLRKISPFKVA